MVTYTFPALDDDHEISAQIREVTRMVRIRLSAVDEPYINIKYSTNGGQSWITPTSDIIEVAEGTSLMVEAGYSARKAFVKYEYIPTGTTGTVYTSNPVTFTVEIGSNDPQYLDVHGANRTGFTFCKKGVGVNQMSYWRPQQTVYVDDNESVYFEPGSTGIANVNSTFNTGYEFDKVELRNSDGSSVIQTYTSLPVNITGLTAGSLHQIWIYGKQSVTKYSITAVQPEHGTITPAGVIEYDEGSTPVYNITPEAGYEVATIYVDGQPVQPDANNGE